MKINDKGDVLWMKYFGGNAEENARGLAVCKNGDLIFTGFTKNRGVAFGKNFYNARARIRTKPFSAARKEIDRKF